MYRSRSVKTCKLKTKSKRKQSKSMRKLSKRRVSKSKKLSKRKQRGGSYRGPTVFIGPPYNAAAAEPQGNYYAYNQRVEAWPVPSNTQFVGGASKSKSKKHYKDKKHHGGGISEMITTLLPEELVNIGRAVPASVGRMYDRFDGSLSSPSSMVYPTQQPLASTLSSADIVSGTNRLMTPPDLLKFYNTNNNQVSRL